jgi:cell division protein FtsQ
MRGRGRSSQSSAVGVPKMAYMKLEGAARVAQSFGEITAPKKLGVMFISAALMAGFAVMGAVWIGGSLLDARETFADIADKQAAQIGFGVKSVVVGGVAGERADQVRAAVLPPDRHSLFSASPEEVKARVEKLEWVEKVSVQRIWPSSLRIDVTRRQAFALWKKGVEAKVIAADGAQVVHAKWNDYAGLPIVFGENAGPQAASILSMIDRQPAVRARFVSATRVGDRRWDIKLKSGAVIALPAENPLAALDTLGDLQTRYGVLDKPVARLDLRQPGRLVVRAAAQDRVGA